MTWLLTSTGREHYLANPSAEHPDNVPSIAEIAHSLAHINRYTGHASRAYSVAEHSLLVMDIARTVFGADPCSQLAALMHDAHECITGDMASPVKELLGSTWAKFEALHEHHLRLHYGLLGIFAVHHVMIKQCDLIALATERRDLLPFDSDRHQPWPVIDSFGNRSYPFEFANLLRHERTQTTAARWAWIFESTATALLEATLEQRADDESQIPSLGIGT